MWDLKNKFWIGHFKNYFYHSLYIDKNQFLKLNWSLNNLYDKFGILYSYICIFGFSKAAKRLCQFKIYPIKDDKYGEWQDNEDQS